MQKYKAYKKSSDYSYTLGIFPTLELIEALPHVVEVVFVASDSNRSPGVQEIRARCAKLGVACIEDDTTIRRLSSQENCFAIGVFKKFVSQLEAGQPHVVLVNPSDTGNVGTIMRSMLGFGCTNLAVIRPAVDIYDPKVVRASMGALFRLRTSYFNTIDDYVSSFTHNLYPFMLDAPKTLSSTHFNAPYSLIFGNEGSGLPDSFAALGTPVRIEQSTAIDSLNLGVSVGIALYKTYTSLGQAK